MGAAALIGAAVGLGAAYLMKPKAPKPPPLLPPPSLPEAKADAGKEAQAAALKKKKAAAAAYGYEDTVLTGSSGLGGVPSAYQGSKTLTGS